MPILDLRIRKGVRRNGVKLAVATSRPSSLDPNARDVVALRARRRRGLPARAARAALGGGRALEAERLAAGRRRRARRGARAGRALLRAPARTSSILYGERLVSGPRGAHAARALLDLAERARACRRPRRRRPAVRARRRQRPRPARGRRAAQRRPRLAEPRPGATPRRSPRRARRRADRALPAARRPGRRPARAAPRGSAALERATTVIAHADVPHRRHPRARDRRLPGRDLRREGRARSRTPTGACSACAPAIGHPGRRARRVAGARRPRPAALGLDLGVLTGADGHARSWSRRCPFYAGLTLDEIGGRGVRWQERDAAAAFPARRARARSARGRASRRRAPRAQRRACGWARSARSGTPTEVARLAGAALPAPRPRVELVARRRPAPGALPRRPRRRRLRRATRRRDRHACATPRPRARVFLGDGNAASTRPACVGGAAKA